MTPRTRTRSVPVDRIDDLRPVVPRVLRVTAAPGWRLLVMVAAGYVLGILADRLAAVVVPPGVAVLRAALLAPP